MISRCAGSPFWHAPTMQLRARVMREETKTRMAASFQCLTSSLCLRFCRISLSESLNFSVP